MVGTEEIMQCLDPIWRDKNPTARRVRARIEDVLNWATVQGFRRGDNPARWQGHLQHTLPNVDKSTAHRAALAYDAMPAFMEALRALDGLPARALELTILCATRTQETLGAQWSEFDLENKIWTVPASRMKMGREHRIPLSARAVEILQQLPPRMNDFVFPGNGTNLCSKAMARLLARMGHKAITVHGFRSCFRSWAADETATQREVIEMALAHKIVDKTEGAYWRSDVFVKRRELMQAWANYCSRTTAAVLPMRKSA
jgi:integrase